ncbi:MULTISPECIES: PAS domain-containing protein [Salegentibacter]|uniref:PAS domain-containing protein n=1 Tax=Salegentibacter TaxID=143222 RepID=UPI00187B6584|nr:MULTISPECIES: PAS domain-containing protein [Salegentibacter]MBE7640065.1 hypothetical protein [Salegentibacter sp. BLCTC]MBI6117562.1 PAS domain-containing protein [Salegentibacter maritimus]
MQSRLSLGNRILSQYFENSIIPQLFVDVNLFIRELTPATEEHFGINRDCIGQKLHSIKNKLCHKAFIENVRGVLITERVVQKEIELSDGRLYQLCIQPYFTDYEEEIDGVILTYIQINDSVTLKEENKELRLENKKLKSLLIRELNVS